MVSIGAARSSATSAGPASTRRSRLSMISSSSRAASHRESVRRRTSSPRSATPSCCAIATTTSSGSSIGASSTNADAVGEPLAHRLSNRNREPALPEPPAPLTVTRRVPGRCRRSPSSAISFRLPISDVIGAGSSNRTSVTAATARATSRLRTAPWRSRRSAVGSSPSSSCSTARNSR